MASPDHEEEEFVQSTEESRIRARIHKLADQVQIHTLTLAEHALLLRALTDDQRTMKSTMATTEQVAHSAALIEAKIDGIREIVEPIRRGINWAIGLVLGAVILAIIGLVIKSH